MLIVEDDYLQASDYRDTCEQLHCIVVGPVATEAAALELLRHEIPDFAIVDLNLSGGTSLKVADALTEQDVPFCFATGHGCASLPEKYASHPCLEKPIDPNALVALIDNAVS